MARYLLIRGSEAEIRVELEDGPTAERLWDQLPIEGRAQLWGDEIYFSTPLSTELEPEAREVVSVGEVCYWPPADALCLFFGPTPASEGDEPRAASAVTVVGRIVDGLEDCRLVRSSETLRVEGEEV